MTELKIPDDPTASASGAVMGAGVRLSNNVDLQLGRHIRATRTDCGLTQAELGRRIGVSFQQVQKYERGANRISASTLVLLAAALDVSAAQLLQLADVASRAGLPPDVAADDLERQLLRSYRSIASPARRDAVINLVAEIAKN